MGVIVFREYDQKSLDWWYNARERCTKTKELKAAQVSGSNLCRQNFRSELNIKIGAMPREAIDIYYPDGNQVRPIHIFFHGGYWKSNDKETSSYVANALVPYGAITVIGEYTLIPEVRMDELIRQCRQVIAWVWKNAERIGGDKNKITISGHSAGGHITACMLATEWPSFDASLPLTPIKAAVATSGLYDLEPVKLCSQNEDLDLTAEEVLNFSPINQSPICKVPLLLPVGGDEGPEFIRQTKDFADAWSEKGMQTEVWIQPKHDHFSIMNQHMDVICEFSKRLRKHLNIDSH